VQDVRDPRSQWNNKLFQGLQVVEIVGKPEVAMTHSTITMGAELKELAGVDEVVVADPVFDSQFTSHRRLRLRGRHRSPQGEL